MAMGTVLGSQVYTSCFEDISLFNSTPGKPSKVETNIPISQMRKLRFRGLGLL